MPNPRTANAVRLAFAPGSPLRCHPSGAAGTGDGLRVVGSQGLKRRNAKPDPDHDDNARRLSKVALGGHRPLRAANCDPVRFAPALTGPVSPPHGRGPNRAEAPGADRAAGECAVFGELQRHD